MPDPVLSSLRPLPPEEQPISVEIKMADGIFIKSMHIHKAQTFIPQHSHVYDHVSMLAVGRIHVWADQEYLGEFTAPKGILIKADVKHTFMSIVDDVLIFCIHNISRTGEVEISEEHQIVKGPE